VSASSFAEPLSSIALNIAEGHRSQCGHRIARDSSAAGSTRSRGRAAFRRPPSDGRPPKAGAVLRFPKFGAGFRGRFRGVVTLR
jgi:hypothetical protein